jgi:hypothetical protein
MLKLAAVPNLLQAEKLDVVAVVFVVAYLTLA